MTDAGDRHDRGLDLMRLVDGPRVCDGVEAELRDLDPRIFDYLVDFAFGDVYAREGDLKHREIAAIAALAAIGGCDRQLQTHLRGAENVGLRQSEILEVLVTLVPFVGFPRVLNALAAFRRVFKTAKQR